MAKRASERDIDENGINRCAFLLNRGLERQGLPPRTELEDFGMGDAADALESAGKGA